VIAHTPATVRFILLYVGPSADDLTALCLRCCTRETAPATPARVSDAPTAGNLERFTGFADVYDANRPSAPARLGRVLASYAGTERPRVVDLGSGTGLSSRWAAAWAASVIGVEPNPDMRAQAATRPLPGLSYREGTSNNTGLASQSADIVLAVQAMHWMEPQSTLFEVHRLLRPGGVFAVIDADWPPVTGSVALEQAWADVHRRIRVLETRVAQGLAGDALRAPVVDDDPSLVDDDLVDPHRNRALPDGVRSWSKSGHLERIRASGWFPFSRELVFDEHEPADRHRLVALLRSQGSYQTLRRRGLSDADIGIDRYAAEVASVVTGKDEWPISFSWRVRVGVTGTHDRSRA